MVGIDSLDSAGDLASFAAGSAKGIVDFEVAVVPEADTIGVVEPGNATEAEVAIGSLVK